MNAQARRRHIWILVAALLLGSSALGGSSALADAASSPAGLDRALSARLDAGNGHVCAVRDDAEVVCWGDNRYGQLGLGNTIARGDNPDELPRHPVRLGEGRTATAVTAGHYHTCALRDGGSVVCWGFNAFGQLGAGHTDNLGDDPDDLLTAVPLGPGRTARAIVAGDGHTCALRDNGTVMCWGNNSNGQLGTDNLERRGEETGDLPAPRVQLGDGRTATAITAGGGHTCALLDDGSVVCWGSNLYGQLGQGHNEDRLAPTTAVPLGSGRTAVAIGAGQSFTCALRDNGTVTCWGNNSNGQLGLGDRNHRGDTEGEVPAGRVPLGDGRTAVAIAVGRDHACAVRDNGTVVCWGYNGGGALGVGDALERGAEDGDLPAPRVPMGGRDVTAVTAADRLSCALRADGTVMCWGYNGDGQLGQGHNDDQGDQEGELPLPPIPLGGRVTTPALRVSDTAVFEGTGGTRFLEFSVSRTSLVGDVSVTFTTSGGNATAASDYEPVSRRIRLRHGDRSVPVRVEVVTDGAPESDETVVVRLSDPSGAVLADAVAVGTIRNND